MRLELPALDGRAVNVITPLEATYDVTSQFGDTGFVVCPEESNTCTVSLATTTLAAANPVPPSVIVHEVPATRVGDPANAKAVADVGAT